MDRTPERLRTGVGFHEHRELTDYVTGVRRDNRGAHNLEGWNDVGTVEHPAARMSTLGMIHRITVPS